MKRVRAALLLIPLLSACTQAQAQQVYRWIDQNGRVHVTDTPPPPGAKKVETKTYSGNTVSGDPGGNSYGLEQAMKTAPVILYTSSNCEQPCAQARALLNRRGIPFREVSVGDKATRDELAAVAGAMEVPVLKAGPLVQKGFEQAGFDSTLDAAGYPRTGVLRPRKPEAKDGGEKPQEEAARPRGPYAPRFSGE